MKDLFQPIKERLFDLGFRKRHGVILLLLAILMSYNFYQNYALDSGRDNKLTDQTTVHFIDVGQGDSSLILSGDEAVLIDAGPTDAGKTVVDYLKSQGVKRLTAAVATHPHEDHIGGMAAVLNAFPVDAFYMPEKTTTTKTFENMLNALDKQGIKPTYPNVGQVITMKSGAYFSVLSPQRQSDKYGDNLNNYSIVLRLALGSHSVLFMGDAEAEVEKDLLSANAYIVSEVLKVGHHGSNTSTTPAFLRKTRANLAIISYGKGNDYGHPHLETLDALNSQKVPFRTTADEGNIVLTFEAKNAKNSADKQNAA